MLAFFSQVAAGQPAAARAMRPEAQAHFERGRRAFAARDYPSAVTAFREGYRIDPHPDFLYTLGQAERLGGNCGAALEAYRAFLETKPPDAEVARTEANMKRCEDEPTRAAPPPASASPTPAPAPPPTTATPATPPAPTPAPIYGVPDAAPPAAPAPWYLDWVGDALAGTGIAGVGVGATLLVLANTYASDANQSATLDDYVARGDRATTTRVAGGVCVAAGSALLIAGLVRYATRASSAARSDGSRETRPVGGRP